MSPHKSTLLACLLTAHPIRVPDFSVLLLIGKRPLRMLQTIFAGGQHHAWSHAQAVEASLNENIARLPMDEIDQYKAFAALQKTGLDIPEIASRYGVTERLVGQRPAIATIMQPILNACRREEIGADTGPRAGMLPRSPRRRYR